LSQDRNRFISGEQQRAETGRFRRLEILGPIVHEQRLRRRQAEPVDAQSINRRIGFAVPDFARHHDDVELYGALPRTPARRSRGPLCPAPLLAGAPCAPTAIRRRNENKILVTRRIAVQCSSGRSARTRAMISGTPLESMAVRWPRARNSAAMSHTSLR